MNRAPSCGLRLFGLHEAAGPSSRRFFLTAAYRCTTRLGLIALLPRVHAESAAAAGAQARTTALAFDAARGIFFKASSDVVLRSDDGGIHWTPLELPQTSAKHRVSSMAVSAGDAKALYIADSGLG